MPAIEVVKNSTETIRVERKTFNDQEVLDVRVHFSDTAGELKPTRKGLTLRLETWRELMPLIQQELDRG